jgi:cytochrome c-type biogenesis protein CcmF
MVELGYIAMLLALAAALYGIAVSVIGACSRNDDLVGSGQHSVLAVGGLVTIAVGALVYAFLTHDFQVEYVAANSNREMPTFLLITALWGSQSGSLLFWGWLLAMYAVAAVIIHRKNEMPYVAAVLMLTEAFFLALVTFVANPFQLLPFVPPDGQGLNPLLRHPVMSIHPPTLYLGFTGFTVPFAFAIAALITRRLDDRWIRTTRQWTLAAWLFLSIGILLGGRWAYDVLGWGGYWSWDAVENASLMPWLTGTAFLHSVMIQERKGMLKVWNMVLIIATYGLVLFGTFITRSGVISSVHAFAQSAIGPWFLSFISLMTLGSLGLLFYRFDDLRGENELDALVSRESTFLLNNLFFVGLAFAVFWGTIFPMISEIVRGIKITVAAPFFNQIAAPLFAALLLLMGICILIGWSGATVRRLARSILRPLLAGLVIAGGLFVLGVHDVYTLIGFGLCVFVAGSTLTEFVQGTLARHRSTGENILRAFVILIGKNRRRYGGYLVHLSVALIAVGIIGSQVYKVEAMASLSEGESMFIGPYRLTYEKLDQSSEGDREATVATVGVYENGQRIGTLRPTKEFYRDWEQPMTIPAVRSTAKEDLYVIVAGWDQASGIVSFKATINPLVSWIWVGGLVFIFGTLVAAWPELERRRVTVKRYAPRLSGSGG